MNTGTSESSSVSVVPKSRWKLWMFRLMAVLMSLLLVVVIEAALRLSGVGYETSFLVQAELEGRPTYRENPRFSSRFFPHFLARKPKPFHIPRDKDDGVYRIVVLGASAAQGDPDPAFGIARILRVLLEDAFPDRKFEVINAAIVAINSHVVTEIARDCVRCDPDLFVVYLGNNEVLGPYGPGTVLNEGSRHLWMIGLDKWANATRIGQVMKSFTIERNQTPQAWRGLELFLDEQVRANDPRMHNVYRHFRRNVESIAATARRASAPVILCTVGVNLRDCAPFASLHRPDLSSAERRKWESLYSAAENEKGLDPQEAMLGLYEKALAIDDQYADLHFRLAQCYEATGDFEAARDHYINARDMDTLRFRCDSELNRVIREVGDELVEEGVHLIDAEQILQNHSLHRLPGRELLYEHVHLTFLGNYLVARAVAQRAASLIGRDEAAVLEPLPEEECRRRLCFTGVEQHRALAKLLQGMDRAPFNNQLDHGEHIERMRAELASLDGFTRPEGLKAAAAVYEAALSEGRADWVVRFNYSSLLARLGERERAVDMLRHAAKAMPQMPELHYDLGMLLSVLGRDEEALAPFENVLELDADGLKDAHYRWGLALARLGRFDEAERAFEQGRRINPKGGEFHVQLGVIYLNARREVQAKGAFLAGAEMDPQDPAPITFIGHIYAMQGRNVEAQHFFEAALGLVSNDASALNQIGVLFSSLGHGNEAIVCFRRALQLDPELGDARANLERALGQSRRAGR